MTSGFPIYWMPTNPSNWRGGPSRYVSYWYFFQSELEPLIPEKIKRFLASEDIDLIQPVVRHMWSSPAVIETAGLHCNNVDGEIQRMPPEKAKAILQAKICVPYEFIPIQFSLDDRGVAFWEEANPDKTVKAHIFKINAFYLYNEAMFQFLVGQYNCF